MLYHPKINLHRNFTLSTMGTNSNFSNQHKSPKYLSNHRWPYLGLIKYTHPSSSTRRIIISSLPVALVLLGLCTRLFYFPEHRLSTRTVHTRAKIIWCLPYNQPPRPVVSNSRSSYRLLDCILSLHQSTPLPPQTTGHYSTVWDQTHVRRKPQRRMRLPRQERVHRWFEDAFKPFLTIKL